MIRAFKADLLYGATGTLKTSNAGKAALYYHNLSGKKTLWVSADGGGWEPVQSLVDEGIIVPWAIRDRFNLLESLDFACQGYWPKNMDDPKSPVVKYPMDDVALVVYEGLTSFGDAILAYMRAHHDTMKTSQEASYVIRDGATSYAGGNISQFGFVQDRLYEFVMKTHMLPVEKVLWTALEAKGEEEGTRIPIFGPAIAGKKATGKAGQWFGNMLHFDVVNKDTAAEVDPVTKKVLDAKISSEYRMYLRPHAEPSSKIMFPAKTRAPFQYATELPEWMTPDLGALYGKIEELKRKASAEISRRVAEALPKVAPINKAVSNITLK